VDEREVALEDVEVGAADSAGEDAEEDVARGEGGSGDVFELEGLVGGVEDGGFHLGGSPGEKGLKALAIMISTRVNLELEQATTNAKTKYRGSSLRSE
jgi:hypothetical protein